MVLVCEHRRHDDLFMRPLRVCLYRSSASVRIGSAPSVNQCVQRLLHTHNTRGCLALCISALCSSLCSALNKRTLPCAPCGADHESVRFFSTPATVTLLCLSVRRALRCCSTQLFRLCASSFQRICSPDSLTRFASRRRAEAEKTNRARRRCAACAVLITRTAITSPSSHSVVSIMHWHATSALPDFFFHQLLDCNESCENLLLLA